MFIEDLWEKFPEQTEDMIKKICGVKEELGDELYFDELVNGVLKFTKYGKVNTFIQVRDFDIRTTYSGKDYANSPLSIEWMKFMKSVYGKKYLYHYIAHRNEQLDKFMARYEAEYNNQTEKVLDELGLETSNTKTK